MTPEERYNQAVILGLQTLQFSASERARINTLLASMTTRIGQRIALENIQGISKSRLNRLIAFVNSIVDSTMSAAWDNETYAQFWRLMAIQTSLAFTPYTEDNAPVITPLMISALLIQGGTIAAWQLRQREAMKFRIIAAIRQGVANREDARQIIARIVGSQINAGSTADPARIFTPGIMRVIQRENEALSNTILSALQNDAAMTVYEANRSQIYGLQQISVLDGNTTPICAAYAFMKWRMDDNYTPIPPNTLPFDNGVPRHMNCRSKIIALRTATEAVPTNTFRDWLSRQTEALQDQLLGKGRAAMWRDGKITLAQLLSGDGSPLTLEELRALYG